MMENENQASEPTVRQIAESMLGHPVPAELADDAAIKQHVVSELLNDHIERSRAFCDGAWRGLTEVGDIRMAQFRYLQRRRAQAALHRMPAAQGMH